jgi:Leucine-rich repeat (LRR) protein
LPSAIGELSELRQIDLRENPIEMLPDSILEMPRLEKLDLRWVNTLRELPWLDALEDTAVLSIGSSGEFLPTLVNFLLVDCHRLNISVVTSV